MAPAEVRVLTGDGPPPEDSERPLPPIEVPHTELSPEALLGVIESFVLREGTDYGEHDVPFQTKVMQVSRQLEKGEAQILYDQNTESIAIVLVTEPRSRS